MRDNDAITLTVSSGRLLTVWPNMAIHTGKSGNFIDSDAHTASAGHKGALHSSISFANGHEGAGPAMEIATCMAPASSLARKLALRPASGSTRFATDPTKCAEDALLQTNSHSAGRWGSCLRPHHLASFGFSRANQGEVAPKPSPAVTHLAAARPPLQPPSARGRGGRQARTLKPPSHPTVLEGWPRPSHESQKLSHQFPPLSQPGFHQPDEPSQAGGPPLMLGELRPGHPVLLLLMGQSRVPFQPHHMPSRIW
jgi:hypothetical protein